MYIYIRVREGAAGFADPSAARTAGRTVAAAVALKGRYRIFLFAETTATGGSGRGAKTRRRKLYRLETISKVWRADENGEKK